MPRSLGENKVAVVTYTAVGLHSLRVARLVRVNRNRMDFRAPSRGRQLPNELAASRLSVGVFGGRACVRSGQTASRNRKRISGKNGSLR